jgi:hypothetical protein
MTRLILVGVAILAGALLVTMLDTPGLQGATTTTPAATAANRITFTGKLTTGIMAIGGETTGTIISDGKTTYELDVKDAALKAKVKELSGKQVTVQGTLTVKVGVEVGQRRIITVESLEAAPASAPAPAK